MRIRGIQSTLHRRFKILCAVDNVSMNKKLIQLIEDAVEAGPTSQSLEGNKSGGSNENETVSDDRDPHPDRTDRVQGTN